jgi:ABC-type transport system involved in cytochrome c biogenesis permease subunit
MSSASAVGRRGRRRSGVGRPLACLALPQIRAGLATVLPLLQILVVWLFAVAPTDGAAPVTYETIWLAVHVWLGKAFLGCIIVAVSLSLVVLARHGGARRPFTAMPANPALDELSYRFVLVAFVFESLMLVAGAIWAQDAWGRYWAWDPLETWAFVTWLSVIAYLHLRVTRRPGPLLSALMVTGIFAVAFSTFFGMPFVSTAPHKGAI